MNSNVKKVQKWWIDQWGDNDKLFNELYVNMSDVKMKPRQVFNQERKQSSNSGLQQNTDFINKTGKIHRGVNKMGERAVGMHDT